MQSLCFNNFGNLGSPCVLASKRRRCAKNTERDDDQHCFVHWQMPSCANGHHDSSARPRKPACRFRAMRAWRQERAPGPGASARSAKRLRKRFGSIVRLSGWSKPAPGRSKSKLFRLPCWRSSPNAPLHLIHRCRQWRRYLGFVRRRYSWQPPTTLSEAFKAVSQPLQVARGHSGGTDRRVHGLHSGCAIREVPGARAYYRGAGRLDQRICRSYGKVTIPNGEHSDF